MKKIALVGSCGSIGRQVADVVRRSAGEFSLCALISNRSLETFNAQITEFKPSFAVLTDRDAAKGIIAPLETKVLSGEDGALEALGECGADIVFVACGGFAGLKYSLKAMETGARLALANKETLVCGGDIIMPLVGELVPVDSEHSAIWQCLNFERRAPFERLIITASGGPFRGRKFADLKDVKAADALRHPTWKMGAKITVDSATLLNKGYEIIEAHHLYNAPYSRIEAVIQPQSIVHSMVEFADGAVLAQLSNPSMELPIQLALTYPGRCRSGVAKMDFTRTFSLDFMPLERGQYPMYDLALECGRRGGIMPTVLNAASEIAVGAFLRDAIGFTDIYEISADVVAATPYARAESYSQLCEADGAARRLAARHIKGV